MQHRQHSEQTRTKGPTGSTKRIDLPQGLIRAIITIASRLYSVRDRVDHHLFLAQQLLPRTLLLFLLLPIFSLIPRALASVFSTSKYNQSSIKVPIVLFDDPVSVMRIELLLLPLISYLLLFLLHVVSA